MWGTEADIRQHPLGVSGLRHRGDPAYESLVRIGATSGPGALDNRPVTADVPGGSPGAADGCQFNAELFQECRGDRARPARGTGFLAGQALPGSDPV